MNPAASMHNKTKILKYKHAGESTTPSMICVLMPGIPTMPEQVKLGYT